MTDYHTEYNNYRSLVDSTLKEYLSQQTDRPYYKCRNKSTYPHTLFDPVNYIMSGGGKRIRPLMVLLTCKAFSGNVNDALNAAISIEILHNFTLVHDDIMDNADTRRGKVTIHKKWDVNTAILVGDELIGLSYRSLLRTKTLRIDEVIQTFTDGVIEVCEGQALDKEFEVSDEVSIEDYYVMIQKKTAELIRTAALIGSIIADADEKSLETISNYSLNIGMAFQIHDDLLDVIANENEFGKKIGGDIIERKKTYLFLKALETGNEEDRDSLKQLYNLKGNERIKEIIEIYDRLQVIDSAKDDILKFTEIAKSHLEKLESVFARNLLINFSEMLLNRNY